MPDNPPNEQSYSLELFQRDVLGLDNESMDFDEATLANALRRYIDRLSLEPIDAFMIHAFADALDNREAAWRLTLKGFRTGPVRLVHQRLERRHSNLSLHQFVERRRMEGLQAKAAISLASEHFAISQATVYRRLIEFNKETARLDTAVQRFAKTFSVS